jgi:predicted glycosyltransferase
MQMKYGKRAINFLHKNYFKQFNQVWVPDYNSSALGGALSRNVTDCEVKYIGPLSHFDNINPSNAVKHYDFAFILSGPEPLRTRLEQRIFKQNASLKGKVLVARGTNLPIEGDNAVLSNTNWEIHDLLEASSLRQKLEYSEVLVSRFGYSTLMDLIYLNKKAILIPTPGQPEQEYLANFHKSTAGIQVVREEDLSLSQLNSSAIHPPRKHPPFQEWSELFWVFDGNGK